MVAVAFEPPVRTVTRRAVLYLAKPPAPSPRQPAPSRRPPAGLPREPALSTRPTRAVFWQRRVVALGALGAVAMSMFVGVRAIVARTGGGPLAAAGAPAVMQRAAARVWVVRPGDTLWSIAAAVDPNGDVRPLVDRMAAQVAGATLYPGERIPIPRS